MKTTKEQIAVMQAFVDGKRVKASAQATHWKIPPEFVKEGHQFNFQHNDYEVIEEKSDGQLWFEAFASVGLCWHDLHEDSQKSHEKTAARFLEARAKREGGK